MICSYCGSILNKSLGEINRARKNGLKLYCNKSCSGLSKRKSKTLEQKIAEKREYDSKYRNKNKEILRIKKSLYNKTIEGRATQKRSRLKQKEYHIAYCKTSTYKVYKQQYDKEYRAKNFYGEFWESAILVNSLRQEFLNYEAKQQNNLINKSQKRKRIYEKIKCKKS